MTRSPRKRPTTSSIRVGYIRVAAGLPERAQQSRALADLGVPAGSIVIDDDRRQPFQRRDVTIASLRPGSVLYIATASVLAPATGAWLACLATITDHGASLHIVDSGRVLNPDVTLRAIADIARALAASRRQLQTAPARRAAVAGGRLGRKPKLTGDALAAAEKDWRAWSGPQALTPAEIAKKHGVGRSTLIRLFGPRDAAPARGSMPKAKVGKRNKA